MKSKQSVLEGCLPMLRPQIPAGPEGPISLGDSLCHLEHCKSCSMLFHWRGQILECLFFSADLLRMAERPAMRSIRQFEKKTAPC